MSYSSVSSLAGLKMTGNEAIPFWFRIPRIFFTGFKIILITKPYVVPTSSPVVVLLDDADVPFIRFYIALSANGVSCSTNILKVGLRHFTLDVSRLIRRLLKGGYVDPEAATPFLSQKLLYSPNAALYCSGDLARADKY